MFDESSEESAASFHGLCTPFFALAGMLLGEPAQNYWSCLVGCSAIRSSQSQQMKLLRWSWVRTIYSGSWKKLMDILMHFPFFWPHLVMLRNCSPLYLSITPGCRTWQCQRSNAVLLHAKHGLLPLEISPPTRYKLKIFFPAVCLAHARKRPNLLEAYMIWKLWRNSKTNLQGS